MKRGAVLAFDDRCRLLLERGEGERTAAWLMCNPSKADALVDDPTAGRVVHHSARVNCSRVLVGNVWALRATDPADLWAALARGEYTDEMHRANLDILTAIGAQADVVFVAFGAAPWRKHRDAVYEALRALMVGADEAIVPDCLGVTPDGAPLHPLARGKFAVRNDCQIFEWPGALVLW